MAQNIDIALYKTAAYLDSYSQSGSMDDPIFPKATITWDGEAGQVRDIQIYARNDSDVDVFSVVVEVVDVDGTDETTWSKLAATQAGLSGATVGGSLALGDMAVGATDNFWLRIQVPVNTSAENKTDLRLRAEASMSSSSSSSSTSSSSSSSSSSSQSSISLSSSSSSSSSESSSSSSSAAAANLWVFKMVDETDFATPETGLTITVQVSKDGGAFVGITGSPAVTEISSGWYSVDVPEVDRAFDVYVLKATAAGAAQTDEAFYP